MRKRDDNKIAALDRAVIDTIVTDGFQNLSIAQIARKANVSTATPYVYYQDKKDMLGHVYLRIKELFDADLYAGFDPDASVKVQFDQLLSNFAHGLNRHPREAAAMGVFNAHPELLNPDDYAKGMARGKPVQDLYQRAVTEQLFTAVDPNVIISYTFAPFTQLATARFPDGAAITDAEVARMVKMSWAACTAY